MTETGTLKNNTNCDFFHKYHDMRKGDCTANINVMSITQTDFKTQIDEKMVTERGALKNETDCDLLHTYHDMREFKSKSLRVCELVSL